MTNYEKFKKLLEYFVAHLEYCSGENEQSRGYDSYIKPLIKSNSFKNSGLGYKEQKIQNQIGDWDNYDGNKICITISAKDYKNRGCYLNWKDTAHNVNASWSENKITELLVVRDSYPAYNGKEVYRDSVENLGLFDGNTPNDKLKIFFNKFEELIKYNNKMEEMSHYVDLLLSSKNVIFTGAPGTGKTFLAKEIAKQLVGATTDDELHKSEQFAFVQFHPSYDYTDFVEGLRPTSVDEKGNIGFELKNGIFKEFCQRAIKNFIDSNKDDVDFKKEVVARQNIEIFLDNYIEEETILKLTTGNTFKITGYDQNNININIPNNPVVTDLRLKFQDLLDLLVSEKTLNRVKDVRFFFNRIHNRQEDSYLFTLYTDKKLKKKLDGNKDIQKTELKKFVFIIDEINRGEISKIFGELFFSIDPNYRGKKGAVKTQYFNLHSDENELFYIPENMYIIGTMNDIDRSVESFDFAMRRRFTWVEVTAEQSAENMNLPEGLKQRMTRLNEQIAQVEGFNASYHIGAAYFLDEAGSPIQEQDIQKVWTQRIEPLLKEYFRGMPYACENMKKLKQAFFENEDNG